MKYLSILISVVLATMLAGCGGGGGGTDNNEQPPVDDTTGPTIKSYSAVYSEVTGNVTITAYVTDSSGVKSVQAFINGGSIATNMYLSSTNTYTGVYDAIPENMSESNVTYTVTIYATDSKGNVSSVSTTFTVPPFGPPPPPAPPVSEPS